MIACRGGEALGTPALETFHRSHFLLDVFDFVIVLIAAQCFPAVAAAASKTLYSGHSVRTSTALRKGCTRCVGEHM